MARRFDLARPRRRRPEPGTAADVMTRCVGTCAPTSTVAEASVLMKASNAGSVPVVLDGQPVGVVTDRDLAHALAIDPDLPTQPVSKFMDTRVVSVEPEKALDELGPMFGGKPGRRALVVASEGKILGLVDWSDLARQLPERDFRRMVSSVIGRAWISRADSVDRPRSPFKNRLLARPWWTPRELAGLLGTTFNEWLVDKVPQLGAALAFYTLLSLAPLLLIAIALAGLAFGEDSARGQIMTQIQNLVGIQGAAAIQAMIASAKQPGFGSLAALIGLITLLVAASGVFAQLQDSMNTIWEVQPKPNRGLWGTIQDRFLSFVMVLGTGFLLLVSLLLSAIVDAVVQYAAGRLPGIAEGVLLANLAVSLVLFTLIFATLFKVLPDVQIGWRDVWAGAVLTTVLFMVGKSVLGVYFAHGSFGSTYGATASIVILLTWVYYSAQILFFGAEFSKAFADRFGSKIVPTENAEPVTEEARAQQGLARSPA